MSNSAWQTMEQLGDRLYTVAEFNAMGIGPSIFVSRVMVSDGWGEGTNIPCLCYKAAGDSVLRRTADGRPAGEFGGIAGQWIVPNQRTNPTESTFALASYSIYPFEISQTIRFNAIAQIVTASGSGTANGSSVVSPVRMVLWTGGADRYPEVKVEGTDLGEYSGAATGAQAFNTASNIILPPGRYCQIWHVNNATTIAARRAGSAASYFHWLGRPAANASLPGTAAPMIGWRHTVTYNPAGVPAPPARSAATAILASENIPQMLLRCV